MADSNQIQVSYTRESTWGTTPSADFEAFPITGGAMAYGVETVRSQTVRSDAQLADSKRVGISPTANYDFELAARIYDDFMRSAVRSDADWSTNASVSGATDIAAVNSGNVFTSSSTDFTASNIAKGQWIYVSGFTTAGNNGWFKVSTIAANSLGVTGATLTDEAAGDSITMEGSYVWSGSTEHSYSLQQQYQDLTDRYHLMTGARLNAFSLNQTPGGIITASCAFDGKDRAQASASGGTVNAAPAEDVASEVDGFGALWIGGTAVSYDVMELSLNVSIPNRPAKGLGSLARTRMPQGSPEVTGSFSVYLDDNTWALDTDWENFTKQALSFSIDLGNDDRFLIDLPQVAFTTEPGTNPGLDGDVMLSFDFAAEPGGSHGSGSAEKTIVISRTQT
jgi:hypothetical protein